MESTSPSIPESSLPYVTPEANPVANAAGSPILKLTDALQERIGHIIVGQEGMIELLLAGLLADGHILLEGVPGVAKNAYRKAIGKACGCSVFPAFSSPPILCPAM